MCRFRVQDSVGGKNKLFWHPSGRAAPALARSPATFRARFRVWGLRVQGEGLGIRY